MSADQHEELEVGGELDRALRASVTGLAQMMERAARGGQDRTRGAADQAREEWLAERDAARRRYTPWTAEGRLEQLDAHTAASKWAEAAAWSGMDPAARLAERDMAARIMATHGNHPATLLRQGAPQPAATVPPEGTLSMNAAYGLAATHAPSWYRIPDGIQPLEDDRAPAGRVEEAFRADWQHYSETGTLPERTQWEQWARHVGRAAEFEPEQWTTPDGRLDEEARDEALARVWDEGRVDRVTTDIADHEAALHEAGMAPLASHVGLPDDAARNQPWGAYLSAREFDSASPDDLARAWRDASAAALTGDGEARHAADQLSTMMRDRRGLNPESILIGALTEQAAQSTEARRAAEDRARKATDSRGALYGASLAGGAAAATSTDAEPVTRERVIELNDLAADFYSANLRPGTAGHRYFTDRLGPEFEAGPWTLGYAQPGWQNLCNHLRSNGATDAEMVAAGLAEPGKFGVRDVFRDRVMMGVRDHRSGELVGFLGRDLSGDSRAPKVRNTGETPAFRKGDQVFGLHEAEPGARLVKSEGPFDAMATTVASEGKAAGVTTMGTQMTDTQAAALASRANGRIWLANDLDDAGQRATEADFYRLSTEGLDVRQVDVPGEDPAAAWQTRPAILQDALADLPQARSAAETVVDRYLASPEANRPGFDRLLDELGPHLPGQVDRELLAARAAADLDETRARREDAESREADTREDLDHGEAELSEQSEDDLRDERAKLTGQLRADESVTDAEQAAEGRAYDRRDEADREAMSDQAGYARDESSHGFSRSTQDQLQSQRPSREGTQAKVQRKAGVKPTRGRILRR